eukprot:scaffold11791_cov116-Isochrysis_galbana.AAC.2
MQALQLHGLLLTHAEARPAGRAPDRARAPRSAGGASASWSEADAAEPAAVSAGDALRARASSPGHLGWALILASVRASKPSPGLIRRLKRAPRGQPPLQSACIMPLASAVHATPSVV